LASGTYPFSASGAALCTSAERILESASSTLRDASSREKRTTISYFARTRPSADRCREASTAWIPSERKDSFHQPPLRKRRPLLCMQMQFSPTRPGEPPRRRCLTGPNPRTKSAPAAGLGQHGRSNWPVGPGTKGRISATGRAKKRSTTSRLPVSTQESKPPGSKRRGS
jgi:hypothetical protein